MKGGPVRTLRSSRIVAGFVAATILAIVSESSFAEPSFEGRPASEWLKELNFPFEDTAAARRRHNLATNAFFKMGVDAIPAVIGPLKEMDSSLRKQYRDAFTKAPKTLQKALPSPSNAPKPNDHHYWPRRAATAMAAIGPEVVPEAIDLLDSSSPSVRKAAVNALYYLGADSEKAIEALIRALANSSATVRLMATISISRIGPRAKEAVPFLIRNLDDSDKGDLPKSWVNIRGTSMEALVAMGEFSKPAIPYLYRMTAKNASARIRIQAADTIWKLEGDTDAIAPILIEHLKNWRQHDYSMRGRDMERYGIFRAIETLGKMEEGGSGAIALLREIVDDPAADAGLKGKARSSLARIEADANVGKKTAESAWSEIRAHFSPTAEFANDLGDFRSPLKFDDGSPVKTKADWAKRRKEILEFWTDALGEWPPMLKDLEVEMLGSERRENFTQHRIRFRWTPVEKTEGYLLIPDGEGKRPAVVTVFYEPDTAIGKGKEYRDFAYQLARRGFVTLSIGTTENSNRRHYATYWPSRENGKVEPLSMMGYAAAQAWRLLADRPEVDAERIGIVGHSYGGKWALFASCLFDRFACAVWSDPGIVFDTRPSVNYWEPYYLGYEPPPWRRRGLITKDNPATGLYPRLLKQGRDLHELHALMAPRPFLVSGGSEDGPHRWKALNHTIAVNKLLGYENRVAMTNRPDHSPNDESNEVIYRFFEHFLGDDGRNR